MLTSTKIQEELKVILKQLRLPTIQNEYSEIADQARAESLSYEQYLFELVDGESRSRAQKRIERFQVKRLSMFGLVKMD